MIALQRSVSEFTFGNFTISSAFSTKVNILPLGRVDSGVWKELSGQELNLIIPLTSAEQASLLKQIYFPDLHTEALSLRMKRNELQRLKSIVSALLINWV
jgi:hypothetical protein